MAFFETFVKFKAGLAKTRDSIVNKVQRLAGTKSKIDDELLSQLEEILIAGDVGVETSNVILTDLKQRVKEQKYESTTQLVALLKEEVTKILHVDDGNEPSLTVLPIASKPYVVMVVGVNGVGKTTTIGKMAYQYRKAGHKVVIGAADTFRAAANEQLEIWAQRAGVEIVQQSRGSDPAAVAFDALNSALSQQSDVVIIDTAGRLHTKTNLMEELKKIKRVMDKRLPGAPHEVLLVLDASTGQNGLQQVKYFSSAVHVTGLVLTKLDGTAKGGIVLAISNEMKLPVRFIGVGEQLDDLQPFDRRAFVDALFEGGEIVDN
jgi:fused signal recognition particle receptor